MSETGHAVDSSDHHERISPELAAMDAAVAACPDVPPAKLHKAIKAVWPLMAAAERQRALIALAAELEDLAVQMRTDLSRSAYYGAATLARMHAKDSP